MITVKQEDWSYCKQVHNPLYGMWGIIRYSKGSGKTRPHIIAKDLVEYVAKTLVIDACRGTTAFEYRVVSPEGKVFEFNENIFELAQKAASKEAKLQYEKYNL